MPYTGLSKKGQFIRLLLVLSLCLNALDIWNYHFKVPDENFYPHGLAESYFVKKRIAAETFLIEHSGHQYTAKCHETITWPDGISTPPRPMGDGCTYIPYLVGKSIAEGIMRKDGDLLVYQPWEQIDTVQTADVLVIVDDTKS